MRLNFSLYRVAATCLLLSNYVLAADDSRIKSIQINSIADVSKHLSIRDMDKTTIFAIDWDEVISHGDDYPNFCEGDNTENFIRSINNDNVNFFILTARWYGCSILEMANDSIIEDKIEWLKERYKTDPTTYIQLGQHAAEETVKMMFKKNPLFSKECFKFKDNKPCELSGFVENPSDGSNPDVAVITSKVVFAGAHDIRRSNKGRVMARILDMHKLTRGQETADASWSLNQDSEIKHVVFIDDDKVNIEAMRDAFKNRSEKLTLFYYPTSKVFSCQ